MRAWRIRRLGRFRRNRPAKPQAAIGALGCGAEVEGGAGGEGDDAAGVVLADDELVGQDGVGGSAERDRAGAATAARADDDAVGGVDGAETLPADERVATGEL